MNYRANRVAEEIKKVISDLIKNQLKDPRIAPLTSVTHVDVSKDMRHAKVYVSVYGSDEERAATIEALKKASGFLRKEVGSKIKTFYTPEIDVQLDNSIERGIHITKLIDNLRNEVEKNDGDE
ncbi:30S ribosome-binding factor RbfA [Caldanaerobius polysaccharolyticus]|uniref:30S ribosome-binding factor RbfA n=1 Tax=Caldanaerobius polysaccharolyticus TaxID=44256 RepID=UPI00047DFEF0|nr:30S ribosome-binding factor RbfA [Caldanaerobius polysaccharolyticus]